jgi:hypothetical protein
VRLLLSAIRKAEMSMDKVMKVVEASIGERLVLSQNVKRHPEKVHKTYTFKLLYNGSGLKIRKKDFRAKLQSYHVSTKSDLIKRIRQIYNENKLASVSYQEMKGVYDGLKLVYEESENLAYDNYRKSYYFGIKPHELVRASQERMLDVLFESMGIDDWRIIGKKTKGVKLHSAWIYGVEKYESKFKYALRIPENVRKIDTMRRELRDWSYQRTPSKDWVAEYLAYRSQRPATIQEDIYLRSDYANSILPLVYHKEIRYQRIGVRPTEVNIEWLSHSPVEKGIKTFDELSMNAILRFAYKMKTFQKLLPKIKGDKKTMSLIPQIDYLISNILDYWNYEFGI